MDIIEDVKSVVNADDVRAAGVALIIKNLRSVHAVLPDEANFFAGVLFGLYQQQGSPETACEIFNCLNESQ